MAPRHEEPTKTDEKATRRPNRPGSWAQRPSTEHREGEGDAPEYDNIVRRSQHDDTLQKRSPEDMAADRRRATVGTWLVLLLFFSLMALLAALFYGVMTG